MAISPTTRIRIENLILKQLGDASAPYRRLNITLVARETGVDPKTVGLVVSGLLDHGKIVMSPLRRCWYRRTETLHPAPPTDMLERIAAQQKELERRIAQLEEQLIRCAASPAVQGGEDVKQRPKHLSAQGLVA